MNENLKEAKLKFAIERTNLLLTLTQKDVVVGKNGVQGHKCQASRDQFSYERSMIAVAIDKNLLQQNSKRITSKRLIEATKQVAENSNEKGTTLSA